MTATTDLVKEMIWAANSLPKVSLADRRALIERGIAASRKLHGLLIEAGRPALGSPCTDAVLTSIAAGIETATDESVSQALLASADVIRSLEILKRQR